MSSAGIAVASVLSPDYMKTPTDPCPDESILLFLSYFGSIIPMRVLESDSIESVKLRIQTCKGFVVRNQKLVCGGRVLARSDSLVRDYGVTDGNVLHLVLKLSDLQVIQVKTTCGKEFTFHVDRSRDVAYVKQKIANTRKGLADLDEQEVVFDGEKLEDQRLIDDIVKQNDAVIHLLVRKSAKVRARPIEKNFELTVVAPRLDEKKEYHSDGEKNTKQYDVGEDILPRKPPDRDFLLEPIIINPKVELPSVIRDMVNDTLDGLSRGNSPIKSVEGTGGAYFMQDSIGQKFVSVFKPLDEEPNAVNNPHGLPVSVIGEGLKKGTRVGEGAFREVAAYILDHPMSGRRSFLSQKGFAGVPPTVMIKCLHKGFNHSGDVNVKIGSLQMFMDNTGSCEDMGPKSFPQEAVHRISVLDIRLANADRHAGNILMSKDEETGSTTLIPIDHGYCLPESFEDCTFDWLYWPQARQPYSPETIEYIKSLDAEEDISLLKFHGWNIPIECARTLRISTMLLKKGVAKGFTPFDIGSIMCRETVTKESVIEEIVQEAVDFILPDSSEAEFMDTLSYIMDNRLDEIAGGWSGYK